LDLVRRVRDFLGDEVSDTLGDEPRAIMTRQLASPDMEFSNFINYSNKLEFKPFCWEFLGDTFVTTNEDKAGLGRMVIFDGYDKNNRLLIHKEKIIDLTGKEENKKISDIETNWGETMVDFHHRALINFYPNVEFKDMTNWYRNKGKTAKEYYPYLLAIFIYNGILFENFVEEGEEEEFSKEIFAPAYDMIIDNFGVKPLIVQAIPEDEMNNKYWWSYPNEILKLIN